MSENVIVAIIAALGGGAIGGILVTFLSFWIDILRNYFKNKNKKIYFIKSAFSEILDASIYLKQSLDLIEYIKEENTKVEKINSEDIRKQIDSINHKKIQQLHDNIFLDSKEFSFARVAYQVKEIKSFLQMEADLLIENKMNEKHFFKTIKENYSKLRDIKSFAEKFLKDSKINF